jgi:hypothetical protein
VLEQFQATATTSTPYGIFVVEVMRCAIMLFY